MGEISLFVLRKERLRLSSQL